MDPGQLYESTMNPQTRTLIQYTTDDIKKEVEQIRRIESDMSQLLIGLDNLSRFDVLG